MVALDNILRKPPTRNHSFNEEDINMDMVSGGELILKFPMFYRSLNLQYFIMSSAQPSPNQNYFLLT
jgi:hypothetical protein